MASREATQVGLRASRFRAFLPSPESPPALARALALSRSHIADIGLDINRKRLPSQPVESQ